MRQAGNSEFQEKCSQRGHEKVAYRYRLGGKEVKVVHCHDAMSIVNWLGCLGGAKMVPTHCLPIAAAPPQQRFTGLCAEDKTRRERRRVGKLCKLPPLVPSCLASISASSKMTRGEFLREREIPILRGSESRPPCPNICSESRPPRYHTTYYSLVT